MVVARGIFHCILNALSVNGNSVGRDGIGSAIIIKRSCKCHNHTARNDVELLLTNATAEEIGHPAQQDSCLEELLKNQDIALG